MRGRGGCTVLHSASSTCPAAPHAERALLCNRDTGCAAGCTPTQAIASVLGANGASELIELDLRDNPITAQGLSHLVRVGSTVPRHAFSRRVSAAASSQRPPLHA